MTRLDEIPGVGVTAPTVVIVEVDNSLVNATGAAGPTQALDLTSRTEQLAHMARVLADLLSRYIGEGGCHVARSPGLGPG